MGSAKNVHARQRRAAKAALIGVERARARVGIGVWGVSAARLKYACHRVYQQPLKLCGYTPTAPSERSCSLIYSLVSTRVPLTSGPARSCSMQRRASFALATPPPPLEASLRRLLLLGRRHRRRRRLDHLGR